jgi:Calpain family cysteine protease
MFAALRLSRASQRRSAQRPPRFRPQVEALEDRAVPTVLVLGSDGNLWSEGPGWQASGRRWVDGNVQSFAQGGDGFIYVQDTNGNLWKENAGWQILGRTQVDYNVQSFAVGNDGYIYVLGTDGNLWKEQPGWQTNGRTWIDYSVRSFALGSDGWDYVLGRDGNLWRELPGWQNAGRTWVDGSVQSFAHGTDGWDYVLGTDGNLWKELPYWQAFGRTEVDSSVHSFLYGGDGYVYVLGHDGNLWREQAGWQTNGRTWIDGSVRGFDRGSDGWDYVLGMDGNLWKELPGWQSSGRTWVDYDVLGVAATTDGWSLTTDPAPAAATAYGPASGTLVGPGGPSYLDVKQGGVGDCWLLASLAEVADRAPNDIRNMFTYDGSTVDNGSQVPVYTVRLFNVSGAAEYFTVDTELPGGSSPTYDKPVGGTGAVNGSSSPVLWVALAEKAYAEANGDGFVTSSNGSNNSYGALGSGWPSWALHAITGQAAVEFPFVDTGSIVNAWNSGLLVVLNTTSPSSSYIVSSHSYAMVGYYSSSSMPFQIFNPWGTDASGWAPNNSGTKYGLFFANAAFVSANFSTPSYGIGAAPGGPQGPSDTAGGVLANVPSSPTTADDGTITRNETNTGTGGATPSAAPADGVVGMKRPAGAPDVGRVWTGGGAADPFIVANRDSTSGDDTGA